jgi:DNA polymerase elongation subunit (family B)
MSTLIEDLKSARKEIESGAKILTFDIETQRSIVEVYGLFKNDYIPIQRVKVPARILCYSARWYDGSGDFFGSAWDDPEWFGDIDEYAQSQYVEMLLQLWNLLEEADVVVTWNGDRFDLQWVEAECARVGLGRPAPYKSVDLMKIQKRHFKAGIMSQKLDWSARYWLGDSKVAHGSSDLWDDIRYGDTIVRAQACETMEEYCRHDTKLTEDLIWTYLPWTKMNLALHRPDLDSEILYCTHCGGHPIHPIDKKYTTTAFAYQQYRCSKCKGVSKGKRSSITTELRPV